MSDWIGYYVSVIGVVLVSLLAIIGFGIRRYLNKEDKRNENKDLEAEAMKVLIAEQSNSNDKLCAAIENLGELIHELTENYSKLDTRVLRTELDLIAAGIAKHVKEVI